MRKHLPRPIVLLIALLFARSGVAADPAPSDGQPFRQEPSASGAASHPLHWAYRPLSTSSAPRVQDPAWCRDPIDAYVLHPLETLGLSPASECDRAVYIRRVTFDLIGLPPTPEEVLAFESDPAPDAYERVVDRLLASPQYGVAQARSWLDLARYADSNGSDENQVLAHAWRYRDYVVDSLNDDLPYERFVTEQLAGDLLPWPTEEDATTAIARRRAQVATGFLVLGPKMLAESDKEKLELDTCDEQLDVISSVFLGSTLACARCHDHKYDPFRQTDYAALAGILRSTRSFEAPAALSRWSDRELGNAGEVATRQAFREERDAAEKRERAVVERARHQRRIALLGELPRLLALAETAAKDAVLVEAEQFTSSTLHVDRETFGSPEVGVVTTNREGLQFAEYRIELPHRGRFALELRHASGDPRPLIVKVEGVTIAERAAGEVTGGFKLENQRTTRIGEFECLGGGADAPPIVTVRCERAAQGPQHFPCLDWLLARPATALGTAWPPDCDRLDPSTPWPVLRAVAEWRARANPAAHANELSRAQELVPLLRALSDPAAALADADLEKLRKAIFGAAGPLPPSLFEDEALFDAAARAELVTLRAEIAAIDARKPPALDRALAVSDGKATELPVFDRGNPKAKRGDPIARRPPAVLGGEGAFPPIAEGHSGRLELARWIASPQNALAARVQVNRIWQHHFGNGLVRTPSNFGTRGEPPTHPDLLDALALDFIRDGGSRKRLQRRIVLSASYRMSCSATPLATNLDPDGRLLSRFLPRRLEAEAIRDALLAVSGLLDPALGGSLVQTADREYVPGDPSSDRKLFATPRRTIYLPRYRNVPFDFHTLFDAPDPGTSTGGRSSTTVAPQALWSLNSPFVHDAALALATRCGTDAAASALDEPARIGRAYELTFARRPSSAEIARAARFLAETRPLLKGKDEAEREREALAALCEMLFSTTAFLYLY